MNDEDPSSFVILKFYKECIIQLFLINPYKILTCTLETLVNMYTKM